MKEERTGGREGRMWGKLAFKRSDLTFIAFAFPKASQVVRFSSAYTSGCSNWYLIFSQ
jgi:hypothetical protein